MLSYAQMSALLYNSKHIPQINQMNPALFTNSGFYISLPSVNLNFDSPLAFSDLYVVKPEEDEETLFINFNLYRFQGQFGPKI